MRSFFLTAKIAAVFALVLAVILLGTLALFILIAGHDVVEELADLRAYQGVELAEEMEVLLERHDLEDPAVRDFLRERADRQRVELILRPAGSEPDQTRRRRHLHAAPVSTVEIDGRRCVVLGPPVSEAWVPVYRDGEEVARVVVRDKTLHTRETHDAFVRGLLQIGVVGLAGVIVLALYLTAPLRRMSRSMDRIAAGELEHRVQVRGRDEVAAMGRSFNAMADRIRDMLVGQKELMAGVSHELRSPLARMKLSLELLRGEGAAHAARVDEIEAEVDAVDDLVEEILLASRIDLGSMPLEREELDLAEVAETAWNRVAGAAAGRGVTLALELADGARRVHADRALTVRLLGNVFENAVRYAERGPVTVSARRAEQDPERVEVTVADQGPGVDEAHLDKLFEPFFRVDGSRSRRTGASGLGLMIVRRAVEAHGGRVRARRAAAGGLAVIFDLPRGPG